MFKQTGDFDHNHSYTGVCNGDKYLMLLLSTVLKTCNIFEDMESKNYCWYIKKKII